MASSVIVEVPVIDFSFLKDATAFRDDTYVKLREACEEWGCFLVVNHGIKEEIIYEMDSAARDIFRLPKETKQKNKLPRNEMGYIASTPANPFYESLGILGAPDRTAIQRFSDYLWPHGNPEIRDFYTWEFDDFQIKAIYAYSSSVEELTINIIRVILQSFEVNSRLDTSQFWGFLRMNYYDLPKNEKGGMATHVDHNCIGLLYQDGTGGLQVKSKAGKWAEVKPEMNSFIVILGDCFKALSNGRIHNVTHRVMMERCHDKKFRVSIPYFYDFSLETVVDPLPEFVDENHPRLYKPFVYGDYRNFYVESKKKKIWTKGDFGSETCGEENLYNFAGIQVSTTTSN
ncbi:hypothetical protein KI387_030536 [Taxus chinensis]|uniref:Fe2OG dioxygenase domain-containing protein n=1 Tax=Taxus chinensis TaxID=29808 RepID=A0AA38FAR4_TAXCH|nr:hypothetical protein KI387_030536 [Taxus chinensis]